MSQLEPNLFHSIIFNLTGHPVVTVPIGSSSEGLSIGVQIVGKRWHEMALLPDGLGTNTLRLNFTNASVDQIGEGIERLGRVLRRVLDSDGPNL